MSKTIKFCLLRHFVNANDAMEVAEDAWNVYFPNSVARPTQTVWLYETKVSNDDDRTFEFSINDNLHVYLANV